VPLSKDYCSIRTTTGKTYSPVEDFVPGQDVDEIFEAFKNEVLPTRPLPWGTPVFRKSGKPTHMINWLSGDWKGWFMSEACLEVFAQHDLGEHRTYPFHIRKDGTTHPYFLLVVKPLNDRVVDISRSGFHREVPDGSFLPPFEDYPLPSNDEYERQYRHGDLYGVEAHRLVLAPGFDHGLDLFAFDTLWPVPFISLRLRKALEAITPTGFVFTAERILHANAP
jgi:hypothetical protein